MRDILSKLFEKNPYDIPEAKTMLQIPEIRQEAIRIYSKVNEVDQHMGAQLRE